VRKAYTALLLALNEKEFDGKLLDSDNVTLILPRAPLKKTDKAGGNEFCSRNMSLLVSEQSSMSIAEELKVGSPQMSPR